MLFRNIFFVTLLLGFSLGSDLDKNLEVETLVKSTKSWDGETLPPYKKGQPQITILQITIPAKAKLALHKHPVINAGVLTEGELTVVTEKNETLRLKAGDHIVEVVEKWHYGINEKDTPAKIIVFYAGVEGEPVTVTKEALSSQ